MDISQKIYRDCGVLSIEGSFEGIEVDSLYHGLMELTRFKKKHYGLDLSELTKQESPFYGALLAAERKIRKHDARLTLISPPNFVREDILELEIGEWLPIADSLEAYLATPSAYT